MHFILLGPPGSGKGTQGEYLEKKLGAVRLSTGDLLREEVRLQTPAGLRAKALIDQGKFVGDDILFSMVKQKLSELKDLHFILDGFPRNLSQAEWLDRTLQELDIKIDYVLNFNLADDLIVERISNRYFCVKCKATYNKLSHNPKITGVCDVCGGTEFSVRGDDKEEIIRERLVEYERQTKPLVRHYEEQGILYNIDVDVDIVEVRKKIDSFLTKSR